MLCFRTSLALCKFITQIKCRDFGFSVASADMKSEGSLDRQLDLEIYLAGVSIGDATGIQVNGHNLN